MEEIWANENKSLERAKKSQEPKEPRAKRAKRAKKLTFDCQFTCTIVDQNLKHLLINAVTDQDVESQHIGESATIRKIGI